MKHMIYLAMAVALTISAGCGSEKETKQTGSIYGIVTTFSAAAEPMRGTGVELYKGSSLLLRTTTFDDGHYEFPDLQAGEYRVTVNAKGYEEANYNVAVEAGRTARADMQLKKLSATLRLTEESGKDVSTLDFGSTATTVRSFNIFNSGEESINWGITVTCDWITQVSKMSGTLKEDATQTVIVTIDRDKLADGTNSTILLVSSDNGSKGLTITAEKVKQTTTPQVPTVSISETFLMSNGILSFFERSSNVHTHYASTYKTQDILSKTDAQIKEMLKSDARNLIPIGYAACWPDPGKTIDANTLYTVCTFAVDNQGNEGTLLRNPLKTPTASGPAATVTTTAVTKDKITFNITRNGTCSYYKIRRFEHNDVSALQEVVVAYRVHDGGQRFNDNQIGVSYSGLTPNTKYVIATLGYDSNGTHGAILSTITVTTSN